MSLFRKAIWFLPGLTSPAPTSAWAPCPCCSCSTCWWWTGSGRCPCCRCRFLLKGEKIETKDLSSIKPKEFLSNLTGKLSKLNAGCSCRNGSKLQKTHSHNEKSIFSEANWSCWVVEILHLGLYLEVLLRWPTVMWWTHPLLLYTYCIAILFEVNLINDTGIRFMPHKSPEWCQ